LQKSQPELTLQESFWGSNRRNFTTTENGQIQHQQKGVLHPPCYHQTSSKSWLPHASASDTKASVCALVPGEDGGNLSPPKFLKTTPTPAPPSHTALSQSIMLAHVELNKFCSAVNDRSLYLVRKSNLNTLGSD
jgi:hypothetical protein